MIIFAISDIPWEAIIGGIVTLLLAWMNLRLGKIAKTGEAAATKVAEVKVDLEKSVEDRNHRLRAIKTAVDEVQVQVGEVKEQANGNTTALLETGMVSAKALAVSSNTEENRQLAKAATDKYNSHVEIAKKAALASRTDEQNTVSP